MKAQIKQIAKAYGCTTAYSGNSRTMFIHGKKADEVVEAARFHHFRFEVIKSPFIHPKTTDPWRDY